MKSHARRDETVTGSRGQALKVSHYLIVMLELLNSFVVCSQIRPVQWPQYLTSTAETG